MATGPGTPDSPDPTPPPYTDRIRALVDAAPPLSPRQRERLRMILAVRHREPTEPAESPEGDDSA